MDTLEHEPFAFANDSWYSTDMSLSLQTETDLNFLREPPGDGLLSSEFHVDPMIEMTEWAQYGIASSVMDLMPSLPRNEELISTSLNYDVKKELDLSIVQELIDSDTNPSTSPTENIDIPTTQPLDIEDVINFDLPTFLEADNDAEFMQLIASNEGTPAESTNELENFLLTEIKQEPTTFIKQEPTMFVKQEPTMFVKQEPVSVKQECHLVQPIKVEKESARSISQQKRPVRQCYNNNRKPLLKSVYNTNPKPVRRANIRRNNIMNHNRVVYKRHSASVGKKLDVQRRCYVYDSDVKNNDSDSKSSSSDDTSSDEDEISKIVQKSTKKPVANNIYTDSEVSDVDIETVSDSEGSILKAKDVDSLLDKFEAETKTTYTELHSKKVHQTTSNVTVKSEPLSRKVESNSKNCKRNLHDTIKNKDISPELLQRMKENAKKKSVQVIDAMPSNRKSKFRVKTEVKHEKINMNSKACGVEVSPEESLKDYMDRGYPNHIIAQIRVAIDHSYCSFEKKENTIDMVEEEEDVPIKKEPVDPTLAILPKTEPFIKQECTTTPIQQPRTGVGQDDTNKPQLQRTVNGVKVQQVQGKFQNINGKIEPVKSSTINPVVVKKEETICSQPIVKNADGKLMVSLLKSNTIHGNAQNNKKKLNLEEYKKRRDIVFISSNNTPISSSNTSPKHITDQTEYLKNLSKMANEVLMCKKGTSKLKTPSLPDIDIAVSPNGNIEEVKPLLLKSMPASPQQETNIVIIEPEKIKKENRSTVNFGTNTEESWLDHDRLNEIKPILENASVKISSNSLLASMIQTVCRKKVSAVPEQPEENVHWENKVVHVGESNKMVHATCNVYVQTENSWCLDHLINNKLDSYNNENGSPSSSRRSRSTSRSSLSPSSRSPSPVRRKRKRSRSRSLDRERIREIEERRVIYIGKLNSRTTKEDLRHRFETFGIITSVSVHHRIKNDSYGFVTYKYRQDAYDAVEHGNDDPNYPKVDLSFGGRRVFCKTNYSDLDNVHDNEGYYPGGPKDVPFDYLLDDFKKLRSRLP